VTYPVIVAASNPDLKLLPGMTATLYFRVDERPDVLRIPNSAFLFFPQLEQVRLADRELLTTSQAPRRDDPATTDAAKEDFPSGGPSNRRYLWVVENDLLKAVPMETGLIGTNYTEIVSGEVSEGTAIVTGVKVQVGG
jgi:HlyD family secretion protein